MNGKQVVLAITGASGSIYGLRLCSELLASGARVTLLVSSAGFGVLRHECGLDWGGSESEVCQQVREYFTADAAALRYYAGDNFFAAVASGSSVPDAMVVAPCSMGTLARIACGNSGNLLERCADVMLKERRPLLLIPRETPLSEIHLENMLKLSRLGVRLIPAMPGFYHCPESVDDLINFVVGKVLDALGVSHRLVPRWGTSAGENGQG